MRKSRKQAAAEASPGYWGKWGADSMKRYAQPVRPRSRKRCHCGCKRRATHAGVANGVALMSGCQFSTGRWVHAAELKAAADIFTGRVQNEAALLEILSESERRLTDVKAT